MGILDNFEAFLESNDDKDIWDDSDLELQIQNPHIVVD